MNVTALGLQRWLIGTHPQWWMGTMLLALHYAVAWGIDDWSTRAVLLAHFGLFLVWQPAWRGERIIESHHTNLVLLVALVLAGWNNWWLTAVWMAVLFALIGGNLLGSEQPRQRLAAMLAAVYLLSLLLMWVVPHLFVDQRFDPVLTKLVQYGLQLLPILIIVLPIPAGGRSLLQTVDLFYSLMLFLLVTGLVLGSFVVKQISHGDYSMALAQSLFVMAALLFVLSWLWNPRVGFMGLGHMLSRYLMSLGLPFEHWIRGLADLAEREREPSRFLSLALRAMCELPWLAGLAWKTPHGSGEIGIRSRFQAEYTVHDLTLMFQTKWSLSPALLLHLKLLTQMVGHFYEAKNREEAERHNAYAQAVYETGARLTHDVKNLLQSLRSLCAAADTSGADEATAFQELMRRQLPQIAQRLSTTLDKLKAPHPQIVAPVDAETWWNGLKQRYTRGAIKFSGDVTTADLSVPGDLFDSAAENLLQNAIAKAQRQPGLQISVSFEADAGGRLTICDSGSAVPPMVAARLFLAPMKSQNGLGIGLYQTAKQAEQLGYTMRLVSNIDGNVCFELARSANSG